MLLLLLLLLRQKLQKLVLLLLYDGQARPFASYLLPDLLKQHENLLRRRLLRLSDLRCSATSSSC